MFDASNMSHEEYYRVHGNLSPARTEQVLDALESVDAIQGAADYVTDAHSGYIGEDFLCKELEELAKIAKTLRGNRLWLENIIEDIKEKLLSEVRNGEYGAECLGKIKLAFS